MERTRLKQLARLLKDDIHSWRSFVENAPTGKDALTPRELQGSFVHNMLRIRKEQLEIVRRLLWGKKICLHKYRFGRFPKW